MPHEIDSLVVIQMNENFRVGARREAVPGAGLRGMLLAAAMGGGTALALALLPTIDAWRA